MHIFFTVKNSLVLLLIVYRLFVICHTRHGKNCKEQSRDVEMMITNPQLANATANEVDIN
jgi:hypothetical protein